MKLPEGSLGILRGLTAEEKAVLKTFFNYRSHFRWAKNYHKHSCYPLHCEYYGAQNAINYAICELFNMWLKTKNEPVNH